MQRHARGSEAQYCLKNGRVGAPIAHICLFDSRAEFEEALVRRFGPLLAHQRPAWATEELFFKLANGSYIKKFCRKLGYVMNGHWGKPTVENYEDAHSLYLTIKKSSAKSVTLKLAVRSMEERALQMSFQSLDSMLDTLGIEGLRDMAIEDSQDGTLVHHISFGPDLDISTSGI